MNPRERSNITANLLERSEAIKNLGESPILEYLLKHREKVTKRAGWLLDFTDKHPMFAARQVPGRVEESSEIFTLLSRSIGEAHLNAWKSLGSHEVKKMAEALAEYGCQFTETIIAGLEYKSKNAADSYPKLDEIDPFAGYLIKTSLNQLASDPLFKRILSLIKYLGAKQDFTNENATLAVFATLVGMAQSYTDKVAKQEDFLEKKRAEERKRLRKHTMRDMVLLYALFQFDHGLRDYLEALNGIELTSK